MKKHADMMKEAKKAVAATKDSAAQLEKVSAELAAVKGELKV